MTEIKVIFDGKTFVPQGPVSLPEKTEATVIISQPEADPWAAVDAETRAYYENGGEDEEDKAWITGAEKDLPRLWDEE